MKKRATVDEKPASLILPRARPHGQSISNSLHNDAPTMGAGIGMQQPIFVLSGTLQDYIK